MGRQAAWLTACRMGGWLDTQQATKVTDERDRCKLTSWETKTLIKGCIDSHSVISILGEFLTRMAWQEAERV
jgi:hypothetical protein